MIHILINIFAIMTLVGMGGLLTLRLWDMWTR